jgi:hypothetical protein
LRLRATVGSYGGGVSYERGTPVWALLANWGPGGDLVSLSLSLSLSLALSPFSLGRRVSPRDPVSQSSFSLPKRWSTTLSSKVKLPHVISFWALCGANLVTGRSETWTNETIEHHRVGVHMSLEYKIHHAVGTYGRPIPMSLGPPFEWCGTSCSCNPCRSCSGTGLVGVP